MVVNNLHWALVLAVCFPNLSAFANDDTSMEKLLSLSMNDLLSIRVKISTQTQQPLSKTPSVVSVITAADIAATGATNLVDILQTIPGIYVRANLFGARPIITFRGASGNQTLLMVNGEPMNDLVWTSGIYWRGLPTTMIERVEIIRGPGSALYGERAVAGVINVITKTAGKITQSEAGLRIGNFGGRDTWVQESGTWNGFDIGVTANLSHTNGYDPFIAKDAQTASDHTYGTHASYAPGNAHLGFNGQDMHFSATRNNWRLLADYMGANNVDIGLTGAAVLDPLTRANGSRYNMALHYDNAHFAQDWGLNAELRYHNLDYTSGNGFQERPPGYTDATGFYPNGILNLQQAAERGTQFEVSGLYSGLRQHAIRIGGGFSFENLYAVEHWTNGGIGPDGNPLPAGGPLVDLSGSPYAFAPTLSRRTSYLFAQDIWTLANDLELTAGARYDHYSDFGDTVNPRLALVWSNTPKLTTKFMYGQAFRAPTYLELYARTSATQPNANLSPERSNTLDVLFSYSASNDLKLSLDLYQFIQYDLIATDSANQYQNQGNCKTRGVELETEWQPAKAVKIKANLSHREVVSVTSPDYSIPKDKAYLRLDWAFAPRWNWDIQSNWIGARTLPAGDPRLPLNAYTLVDTTVRYNPSRDWVFAASIHNLFDADAREYTSRALTDNLPLPTRSLYTEIRYKF